MTWLLYVAIEPFIRKLHPNSLVSWSRLLAGRVSDPAVGRDVLFGVTLFAMQSLAVVISIWALDIGKVGLPAFAFASGENPLAVASYIAAVIRYPAVTVGSNLGFLLVYVVARWMLGRFDRTAPLVLWAAVLLFTVGAYNSPGVTTRGLITFATISASASTYLAVRHGLLAFVTFNFIQQVSLQTVATLDPTDWYFASTAIFVLLIAALTVFGIKTSTDQKLLPSPS